MAGRAGVSLVSAKPEIAGAYVDVGEAILTARRLPCICPKQHEGAKGATIEYSTSRRIVTEHVACERCPRTWKRVNCR